jgi:hypothetical protein
MTRDEAKLLLEAMRPDDDANDPLFAEALALASTDPELAAWREARRTFDRGIAEKLEEIPPPPALRDTILAEGKIVSFPLRSYLGAGFAMAAALVLVLVVGNVFFTSPGPVIGPPMLSNVYTASVLPLLGDDKPALGMISSNHGQVEAWLKDRNSPMGSLPDGLVALPSVGCQTLEVHGHAVSLICFVVGGGGVAHLFIVNEGALADPPGDLPEYGQTGGWSTAAWSRDGKSYILATRAGPEALRALL